MDRYGLTVHSKAIFIKNSLYYKIFFFFFNFFVTKGGFFEFIIYRVFQIPTLGTRFPVKHKEESLKNGSFFRPEVLWLSPLRESNLLCKPHKTSSISRKEWS